MTTTEERPHSPADEPFVIDAEPAGEPAAPVAERGHRHGALGLVGRRCRSAVHVVTNLPSTSPAAKAKRAAGRASRQTARAGYTASQGAFNWARRLAMTATFGGYREQIRLARVNGDREAYAEWVDRLDKAKDSRQKRILALPRELLSIVLMAGAAFLLVGFILLVCGIGAWLTPGGFGWLSYWDAVGGFFGDLWTWIKRLGTVALYLSVPAVAFAAWVEGKSVAATPHWLMTADEKAEADSVITSDGVTLALANLKIAALSKALLKDGQSLDFLVNPREQGGGTYFQVRLPIGVAAVELLDRPRVELLAANLNRHRHEVWPQRHPDADARVLDCWIADKGTLDKPAPPWPLLDDGEFDVFADRLPIGATMRSEQIEVGLLQKHWLIGATSKQGKTTVVRLVAMGLALDPSVELQIADLKGDGDWTMFRERASVLIEGQAEEHAESTCVMLEEACVEMARRYEAKRAAGIVGPITREISRRKGSGFHPVYLFVDECQVLYGAPHPIGGSKDDARAWRAAKRLHDQARAVNIHLVQATQRPDNRTLPVMVREGAHVRGSLNVPNAETAKMVLADAADRGARPQDLRAGADRGTIVLTGEVEDIPDSQAFIIVRSHFVDTDQAYAVLDRAVELRRRAGREDVAPDLDDEPVPDPLVDVRDAMRDEPRVRTTVVLGRLAEHDPAAYAEWSAITLSNVLGDYGIEVRKSDGQRVVRLDDVSEALARRDGQGSAGTPTATPESGPE
ncbi:hypothetical protein [Pseudonocardia sp. McavD-2-B]|uniref:hypothetical protein n=1 Tax=Pseudonocardia sp. McavD-2-B TaxID=2954499 RepID=UPI002097FEFC|nr:hypothetical protein [Pseudonocardia sp. McavD-2-B]MCO7195633.1 hypothetical protein [Pseudonocardia sp. McavD-2-B]